MSALDWNAGRELALAVARTLWQVSWQAAFWALGVWALTRVWPKLPASARTTLWWLVGLKCLVGLCVVGAVRLPLLPAPEASPAHMETVAPGPALAHDDARPVDAPHVPVRDETPIQGVPWKEGVLLLWLGGLAWQGRELLRGLVRLRHLRREARPLEDDTLHQAARVLGRKLGLTRIPALLVSEEAPSPLALGLLRPEVILPRRALESLSPLEQRMALAHELAHVRRRDLWLGWVPALARAVFFFHPLVRRACQEYALAREEACDAAALQATGAEPHDYGRLLILFGVARAPAAAAASGAPSHLAALKRRIAMLEHAETDAKRHPHWARWVLGGLALVALVPFQVVAREAPAAATAPGVPGKLAVPHSPRSAPRGADEDSALSYVLIDPPHHTTMSGSTEDLRAAQALAGGGKEPLLYVRQDGQAYIIRDAATLKAVEESFDPQRAIGEKQSELGHKQSELGHKQSELGHKQSELGHQQATIGRKMAEVARKRSDLALERHRLERTSAQVSPELERQEQELEREMEPLEKQMEELGRQMEVFTQPMEELGRQMEELGKPMEELGRQMELATQEAQKKVRALLDDAIRKGLAEPVKR
ncbi:M56 family metallopeptidase [Cystobacter fuscus]|uniref:M56 family metallopeptidase n=1 Tax=Cystobacter fuscus TaxID=43 RepID=UPI002B2B158A|nr:biotin transporter BioY [Cystobacter fuscus]